MGRTLAVAITSGLVVVITLSLAFGAAVRAGIAPDFDQQIVLYGQHRLIIHNGPSPICASIANPPQHDCFRPGLERRAFSVDYLASDRVRPLIWFRLPPR